MPRNYLHGVLIVWSYREFNTREQVGAQHGARTATYLLDNGSMRLRGGKHGLPGRTHRKDAHFELVVAIACAAAFTAANAECAVSCTNDMSKCCPQPELNVCGGDTRGDRRCLN